MHTILAGATSFTAIHRDPQYFPRILDFLRDGVVEDVPPEILAPLQREADFYSIDPLRQALQLKVWFGFPS